MDIKERHLLFILKGLRRRCRGSRGRSSIPRHGNIRTRIELLGQLAIKRIPGIGFRVCITGTKESDLVPKSHRWHGKLGG
jgi:hypothetical protein